MDPDNKMEKFVFPTIEEVFDNWNKNLFYRLSLFNRLKPLFWKIKMIFDFECGIPVGDILAIMYYVRRTYFKDKDIIHDKEYHHFIEDLVKEKGIP